MITTIRPPPDSRIPYPRYMLWTEQTNRNNHNWSIYEYPRIGSLNTESLKWLKQNVSLFHAAI